MAKPFTLFGATGKFPRGKLRASDEGELRLGVTVSQGTVLIAFGKPVAWLGMDPEHATAFADALRENAEIAEKQRRT